ncbi:phage portal protein [Paracoccus chinensis]|uniref:phage portal protein n=1 Tax=Paracoccus chinensis TaxID=525640 RepID=UPI001FDFA2B6|nr:phage portal protein [Paracoccus chinensis]
MSLANLSRAYEGASGSRATAGWRTTAASSDAIIASDGATLRERSRDLARNNPYAAKALQVLVNASVGYGIRPRAKGQNKRVADRLNVLWEQWAAVCDADGHTNFDGVLGLVVRQMFEGGDGFLIRRWRPASAGLPLPFQLEVREAEHLDEARVSYGPQDRINQGIEYDAGGRRVAYWMHQEHPGDTHRSVMVGWGSKRIPASEVAHLFERQRTQSRGVPWGAPAMIAIRDLDDWMLAERVRKKTEACMVGVLIGEDTETTSAKPGMLGVDGRPVEGFEPGMLAYASGARDVKFNQPAATAGVYEWNSVQGHAIAAGYRVPYELLTGDLKQVNFSSSRVGMNEFRSMIEVLRWQTIIPMACERVWSWFCEAAYIVGIIPTPHVPVEWDPPAFPSVNPLQDAQADLLEVRAGFASLPQMIAKRGYSPDAVATEQAEFLAKAAALGLIYDSDPAKVSKGGQAQQTDAPGPAAAGAGQQ